MVGIRVTHIMVIWLYGCPTITKHEVTTRQGAYYFTRF